MAKRKKRFNPGPPMKHQADFAKYLEVKPKAKTSSMPNTHCGFRLTNQLPLYRIDNLETIEL